eukprot:m.88373 g.88373  ORF g.88373 m.88373 type:complete len:596 (+) comp14826_c0_seq1:253-2040(+)
MDHGSRRLRGTRASRRLKVARDDDNDDDDDDSSPVASSHPTSLEPGAHSDILSTPQTGSPSQRHEASLQQHRRQAKRSRRELLLGRALEATRASTTFVSTAREARSDSDDDGATVETSNPLTISSFVMLKQIPTALRLPAKFALLAQQAEQLDLLVCQAAKRGIPTFDRLKPQVQRMTKRTFTMAHLAQIGAVMPEYYFFKQILRKDVQSGSGSYALRIALLMPNDDLSTTPVDTPVASQTPSTSRSKVSTPAVQSGSSPPPQTPKRLVDVISDRQLSVDEVQDRSKIMRGRLLDRVFQAHADYLRTLPGQPAVAVAEIQRWHEGFRLQQVPDVEPVALPQPPSRRLMTASDVLSTVSLQARRAVARVAKPEPKRDGSHALAPTEQFDSPVKPGSSGRAPDQSSPERTRTPRSLPSTPDEKGGKPVSATIHKALSRAAAKEQGNVSPTSEMVDSKRSQPKQSEALLQGLVSSDMLHRIRQRDKAKTELNLKLNSNVSQRHVQLTKLSKVISIVWGESKRRASSPLGRIAGLVAKGCRESTTTAIELLRFAAEVCPDWCTVLEREKKEYFKVNLKVPLSYTKTAIQEAINNLDDDS